MMTTYKLKRKLLAIALTVLSIITFNAADLFAGNVILAWDPPTTNVDGSPLTDLEGYKVYYGTASNSYSSNTDAGNVTTYQISNLTDGLKYYFAVTAYDTSGNESDYSNEISGIIGTAPPPPPAPEITVTDSVSPSADLQIPFGNVMEGDMSDETVTIRNDGNADIVIGPAAQANPLAAPFSITSDNCSGQTLAPSATCTFTVRLSPAGEGAFNDSFDIPSNDTDENPATITLSGTGIANNPPLVAISGQLTGAEGQAVSINGSGSTDADGTIVLYEWDMDNDGTYDHTSASPDVSHTYVQHGTYTIKLRVTDNLGASGEATAAAVISDTSPSAGFTASPTSGNVPLAISFTSSSTGYDQPLSYGWDFDNDGSIDSTLVNPSYTYSTAGTYTVKLTVTDSDGSINTLSRTGYITATADERTLSCTDSGNVECIERTDGGSDSDNLDRGMPKADLEYEFKATLKDSSGSAPEYIKLFMSQRSSPGTGDFYSYDMSCSGDYSGGALCTYTTKLGPAAAHKFYIESKTSDGTILRHPAAGYITGPEVVMLANYNIVGLPRDTGNEILDGNAAFGSSFVYRWDTDLEYYKGVTSAEPVKPGEGYFVYKNTDTLPELAGYGDIADTEFTYTLRPGWNMVSNPYGGNVRLSDITVRKGGNVPVTWAEAVLNGWLTNAVYYYNGTDWGDTYSFETGQNAGLVPWLGCWINLGKADDTYYLVIPKP